VLLYEFEAHSINFSKMMGNVSELLELQPVVTELGSPITRGFIAAYLNMCQCELFATSNIQC
jgi:hypothetical protein